MTHPPPFFATWQPIASHDGSHLAHALLMLADGTVAPGRYSSLNHCWLAWTAWGYVDCQPTHYVDLLLACARQRRPQQAEASSAVGLD